MKLLPSLLIVSLAANAVALGLYFESPSPSEADAKTASAPRTPAQDSAAVDATERTAAVDTEMATMAKRVVVH